MMDQKFVYVVHWKCVLSCSLVIVCMIDRQYASYCFLASELSIEKKIKYSRQAANSQSMGFAINILHAQ